MSASSLTLILFSVTLSAIAQIAFKYGVLPDAAQSPQPFPGHIAKFLTPGVIVGLMLYGVGTLLWLTALGRVELSQAYPFVGIGFALTTLAGWWLFGEQLSAYRVAGIALIIGGIVLVARN